MADYMSPMHDGSPPEPPPGLTKRVGLIPTRARPPRAAAAPLSKPEPDTPAFLARVEAAVVDYLSKIPSQASQMTRLGVYLRAQGLAPQEGLKKFLLKRSKFYYYDEDKTAWVALVAEEEEKADPLYPAPPAVLPLHAAAKPINPHAAVPPGVDEKLLERQLVSYILEKGTRDNPRNLPMLGEYCIEHLGFSMKGYLHRFLIQRMHLFRITDDGRQHVLLQQGAAEAVGAIGPLPPLPDDILGGGSGAKRAAATAAAPAPAANARPVEYVKWDRLSQEIYDFLISKGGSASFQQVDEYIVINHRDLVEAAGVRWAAWDTKKFTWKRRSIFRKDGTLLSVHNKGPLAPAPAAVPLPTAVAAQAAQAAAARALASPSPTPSREEAFPPLGPAFKSSSRANGAAAAPAVAAAPVTSAGAAAAVKAFAEERKAMEALRDEVQSNLNSLKALSELQKENASLRAGIVTLGREVLAIKQEMDALKSSLNNAPVGTPSSSTSKAAAAPAAPAPAASDTMFLDSVTSVPEKRGIAAPTIALIGGHDAGTWLDSVETYCPSTGAWGTLPAQARSFAAAAAAPDGSLYVAGGSGNGVEWYDSAAVLAPGAASWRELAPLKQARGSAAAGISQDGYFFVFGGGKPGEQYSAVEWYDPAADRWLTGPELSIRRFALAGAALDGALYAIGGYDGQAYLKTMERLDPREGQWRAVAAMAGQRGGLMCAAAGGNTLYALGGYSKTALQACEVYDTRADAWRPIALLKDCRAYGAAAARGADAAADVFVLGGLRSDMRTHAPLVERYVPGKDAWEDVELPVDPKGRVNVNPRRSFLSAATLLPAV